MKLPKALPVQHSVTTMPGLRDELALAQEQIARLELELAEAWAQVKMRDGTLNMAVDRLGGIVEGNPTGRHNFLQRIDELVAKEADAHSMSELLCPIHASLDKSGKLRPFDNCIACIHNERDELRAQVAALTKPVSAVEFKQFAHPDDWGVDCTYINACNELIAARAKGGQNG
jgi:hypothetical protein